MEVLCVIAGSERFTSIRLASPSPHGCLPDRHKARKSCHIWLTGVCTTPVSNVTGYSCFSGSRGPARSQGEPQEELPGSHPVHHVPQCEYCLHEGLSIIYVCLLGRVTAAKVPFGLLLLCCLQRWLMAFTRKASDTGTGRSGSVDRPCQCYIAMGCVPSTQALYPIPKREPFAYPTTSWSSPR